MKNYSYKLFILLVFKYEICYSLKNRKLEKSSIRGEISSDLYCDQNRSSNLIVDKRWLLIIILNQLWVQIYEKTAGQAFLNFLDCIALLLVGCHTVSNRFFGIFCQNNIKIIYLSILDDVV